MPEVKTEAAVGTGEVELPFALLLFFFLFLLLLLSPPFLLASGVQDCVSCMNDQVRNEWYVVVAFIAASGGLLRSGSGPRGLTLR